MFGLTFEKLLLVAVLAGLLIGPRRLPEYAHRLAETVRAVRRVLEDSRTAAHQDLGVPLAREEWEALDLRQYDPRRIVREALSTPAATPQDPDLLAQAARVRPGQEYLVTGSAAHPRRVRIAALPADDPRRRAAEGPTAPDATRMGQTEEPEERTPR